MAEVMRHRERAVAWRDASEFALEQEDTQDWVKDRLAVSGTSSQTQLSALARTKQHAVKVAGHRKLGAD